MSPSLPCPVTLSALSCHPHCPVMSPRIVLHYPLLYCIACTLSPPIVMYHLHPISPPIVQYRAHPMCPIIELMNFLPFSCCDATFISSLCDYYFYFFIVRLSLLFLHCAIVTFIFSLCDCRGPIHCSELKALAVVA